MRKLCAHVGCGAVFEGQGWYCPTHKKPAKKRDYKKTVNGNDTNKDFYNSTGWRSISKRHRISYPICEKCGRKLATDVDHHLELSLDPEMTFARDKDNHVSMCKSCHFSKGLEIKKLIGKGNVQKIREYLIIEHPRREDADYLKTCEIVIPQ